ncbi:siderophore biosynthesis protein SbnG [Salicibibacter halophilus]|uniref:Siderophore biosynthesis protein SbnG n=1 Tax=Salicibibacter halophilus TaxID=2502791 RepID=A0A514LKZ8_9BACI|nr:aldolase/citrate lyase family protein [Salicibibacter halophilus]QDI92529.1 siderophore biosynthesis protein SbnG [Salicibibacter halophilus]
MMRPNRLKQKIESGQDVYGMFLSTPHPVMAELVGYAAFDFVIIDDEHAPMSKEMIEQMIRAAEVTGATPLVRVPGLHRHNILKVLDAGAQGIVIPHVESREQMEIAVQHIFYHPVGQRSLNSGRAGMFAKYSLTEYIARANEEILLAPMIESEKGVDNREEILSCPRISFVLEGAADLSQSLSIPWQVDHSAVQTRLQSLWQTACSLRVPYAVVSRNQEQHQAWAQKGANIFVLGDERGTAFRAYQEKLAHYRYLAGSD